MPAMAMRRECENENEKEKKRMEKRDSRVKIEHPKKEIQPGRLRTEKLPCVWKKLRMTKAREWGQFCISVTG